MNIHAGMYLKSTTGTEDEIFGNAVVFIAEHNAKGSIGFVVNKIFSRTLNQLEAYKHCMSIPLYEGGPVNKEHLFFIHRCPELLGSDVEVGNGIFLGGDFAASVRLLNEEKLGSNDIKIFIGYCGWDYAQLEDEVAEEEWQLLQLDTDTLFTS